MVVHQYKHHYVTSWTVMRISQHKQFLSLPIMIHHYSSESLTATCSITVITFTVDQYNHQQSATSKKRCDDRAVLRIYTTNYSEKLVTQYFTSKVVLNSHQGRQHMITASIYHNWLAAAEDRWTSTGRIQPLRHFEPDGWWSAAVAISLVLGSPLIIRQTQRNELGAAGIVLVVWCRCVCRPKDNAKTSSKVKYPTINHQPSTLKIMQ